MSTAEDLFRAGKLAACLAELQNEVRRRPAEAKLRVFLVQLLMITGDWDRALNQLAVVGELDAGALPMKHAYTAAIQCERVRAGVFRGERSPLVFGEPPQWIASMLQSLALQAQGRTTEAADMRARGLEDAPATPGTLNGSPFEWIADADTRLGPVLEVLLNGSYYWVPFERIQRIAFDKPEDARDLIWLPAQFTWSNGGEAMGLVPVRYPASEADSDDAVRLSRKTQWIELAPDSFAGLGQRVLATSADELGILEVREVTLDSGA
jgi:type VI secretion system protein ImpE